MYTRKVNHSDRPRTLPRQILVLITTHFYPSGLVCYGLVWKVNQDDLDSEYVGLDGFTNDSYGMYA